MKRIRTVLLALVFCLVVPLGTTTAQLDAPGGPVTQEFIPEHDYRVVEQREEDGTWTIGVFKVWYYPDTAKTMIYEVSRAPVAIRGASRKEVRREIRLYNEALKKEVLVFPGVEPHERSKWQ